MGNPLPSRRYALVQIIGCCLGAILAHAMFELPLIQQSLHARSGPAQYLAEIVATGGLILVVLGVRREQDAPWMVGAWIGAAYWFTSSTSFANPAITIARSLTDTFSGIRPINAPMFIGAQFLGAGLALLVSRRLFSAPPNNHEKKTDTSLLAELSQYLQKPSRLAMRSGVFYPVGREMAFLP